MGTRVAFRSCMSWAFQAYAACPLRLDDSQGMRAFLNFRRHLSMPNCALYVLEGEADGRWSIHPDRRAMRLIAAVQPQPP